MTLDNRQLNLNLDISITPQAVHRIEYEGMPIDNSRNIDLEATSASGLTAPTKGDLFIKFDIQFPTNLMDAKRAKILQILKKNADETTEEWE